MESCGAEVNSTMGRLQERQNNISNSPTDNAFSSMNMNSMTFSPEDPPRIYLKNRGYPGAAFSRSIGDAIAGKRFLNFLFYYGVETIGVISEGEIVIKKLQKGVRNIVIASDGLWNLSIPEDVVTSIHFSTDLAKTALSLVVSTYS